MQEAKNIYCKLEARKVEVLGLKERTEVEFWHRLYSGFQFCQCFLVQKERRPPQPAKVVETV